MVYSELNANQIMQHEHQNERIRSLLPGNTVGQITYGCHLPYIPGPQEGIVPTREDLLIVRRFKAAYYFNKAIRHFERVTVYYTAKIRLDLLLQGKSDKVVTYQNKFIHTHEDMDFCSVCCPAENQQNLIKYGNLGKFFPSIQIGNKRTNMEKVFAMPTNLFEAVLLLEQIGIKLRKSDLNYLIKKINKYEHLMQCTAEPISEEQIKELCVAIEDFAFDLDIVYPGTLPGAPQ